MGRSRPDGQDRSRGHTMTDSHAASAALDAFASTSVRPAGVGHHDLRQVPANQDIPPAP